MTSHATVKHKKSAEAPILAQVKQRCREGIFILGMALALFLLVSLLTYHATDPAWSHTAVNSRVINGGGRVGAWLADLFLYIFGYVAYLVPAMLVYGLIIMLQQTYTEINQALLILRCTGFILTVAALCGLSSLYIHSFWLPLPFSAGGILGNLTGLGLATVFNSGGTTLFLSALFLMGILFFTGLSWIDLLTSLNQSSQIGLAKLPGLVNQGLSYSLKQGKKVLNWVKLPRKLPVKANKVLKEKPVINFKKTEIPIVKPPVKVVTPVKPSLPEKAKSSTPIIVPDINLLNKSTNAAHQVSEKVLQEASIQVEKKLLDFGIKAQVMAVHPGPVITRYELALAPGVKVSKVVTLAKDLARSLSTTRVRVVEVIPGKSVIGLELPNESREMVTLRDILESNIYTHATSSLTIALGKDIAGLPVIADLAKMPHLLVAGTTGAGKSVGLNAMLLSILYKATPEEVRFILIDPKMLELSIYDGIPHLLTPVVTDMKEAITALRWCVAEMEKRYKLMASLGVRNLASFNKKVTQAQQEGKPLQDPLHSNVSGEDSVIYLEPIPRIVVIIDELADMMMVVGKKVEDLIARIAQKARAAGIHLILATQRPSVDVITGLIKANIPTRIGFQVSSRIDSRTILDQQGAEQLLGQGDMLYLPPGTGIPTRVHGAFVSDDEVHNVVKMLKKQSAPNYKVDIFEETKSEENEGGFEDSESDPLYDQAVALVTRLRKVSTSSVQRHLKIGYNRAARIVDAMEAAGVVSSMSSAGAREVLAPPPVETH